MCLQNRVTWSKMSIFASCCIVTQIQHSVVRIVTSLGVARPKNRGSIHVAGQVSPPPLNVRNSSGIRPISYSIDNGGTFFGGKGARA